MVPVVKEEARRARRAGGHSIGSHADAGHGLALALPLAAVAVRHGAAVRAIDGQGRRAFGAQPLGEETAGVGGVRGCWGGGVVDGRGEGGYVLLLLWLLITLLVLLLCLLLLWSLRLLTLLL